MGMGTLCSLRKRNEEASGLSFLADFLQGVARVLQEEANENSSQHYIEAQNQQNRTKEIDFFERVAFFGEWY